MKRYIAILRGINVGGHRKILMADLKALLSGVGLKNIDTYIQSGNVAFESNDTIKKNESLICKAIKDKYGYDVPVIVRTKTELEEVLSSNPFLKEVGDRIELLAVVFFDQQPSKEKIEVFNQLSFGDDKFFISGQHAFLKYKTKSGDSKMTHSIFESKLKVVCSARNWKTCLKLRDMAT